MAGLLLGSLALNGGLVALPARHGKGLQHGCSHEHPQQQQHQQQHLRSSATSCFVLVAACSEGLAAPVVAELSCGGAGATTCSVGTKPPRVANRRLTVPAYALAGARTRRRRGSSGLGGGGDDDESGGGDDGSSNFWGGDGGSGGGDEGDIWGSGGGDEGDSEGGSLAARLQDLLLLWSVFCGLAFAQAVAYVSPKPKASVPPAFAALSYSGIKATLLQRSPQPVA